MNLTPENIVWAHSSFQPLFDELQKKCKKIEFVNTLADTLEDDKLFPPDQRHLIILDDVIFQVAHHS